MQKGYKNIREPLVATADTVSSILDAFEWQMFVLRKACLLSSGEGNFHSPAGQAWTCDFMKQWDSMHIGVALCGIDSHGLATAIRSSCCGELQGNLTSSSMGYVHAIGLGPAAAREHCNSLVVLSIVLVMC